jgi:hypothetical protein
MECYTDACSTECVPADASFSQVRLSALRGTRTPNPSDPSSARSEGSAWDEIGQSLGASRQAAWERFATSEHKQLRKISLERLSGWQRR